MTQLPWPAALRSGRPLSVREAYRTGHLISERVRAGYGRFDGPSVRDVAEMLGSSPATLYRAVKVYDVVNKYELKKSLSDLSPTLLHNLERVPSKQRKRFLQRALKEQWSKREIIRRITGEKLGDSSRLRPKSRKTVLTALRNISKLPLDAPVDKRELTMVQVWHAQRSIRAIRRQLRKWESQLD